MLLKAPVENNLKNRVASALPSVALYSMRGQKFSIGNKCFSGVFSTPLLIKKHRYIKCEKSNNISKSYLPQFCGIRRNNPC